MIRAVVTGGAGFLGSHLVDRLLAEGCLVVCIDSMASGTPDNLDDALRSPRFDFLPADVRERLYVPGPVHWVVHLACPASPVDYSKHPVETMHTGALGTMNAIRLALEKRSKLLFASTSEVYGCPLVHPQPEDYFGNVDPVGPRSCYDEAKRFGEALVEAHRRIHGLPVKIARIFNTYGPRMRRDDGRVVPTFIDQALRNAPLTVHGDGSQTRSLCYVDDLIEGLWRFLTAREGGVVNLGNPEEMTVLEIAHHVRRAAGSDAPIRHVPRPQGDPDRRRPNISRAITTLGWQPRVPSIEGIARTIEWARRAWDPPLKDMRIQYVPNVGA